MVCIWPVVSALPIMTDERQARLASMARTLWHKRGGSCTLAITTLQVSCDCRQPGIFLPAGAHDLAALPCHLAAHLEGGRVLADEEVQQLQRVL